MDWITSPEINAQVAEYFGEAPAQTKACEFTTEKDFCDIYHATDADYAAQIHYWTTPQKQCVDGSGDNCTTYDEWVTSGSRSRGDRSQRRLPLGCPRAAPERRWRFLLVPPLAWLVVAYLGSLAVLLVSAFWSTNSFTGAVVHKFTTDNIVAGAHRRGVPASTTCARRRGAAVTVICSCSRCRWRCTWRRSRRRGCGCCWWSP